MKQTKHQEQAGFIGVIEIEAGHGRSVVVNLWESEEAAATGLRIMGSVAAAKVMPHTTAPPELITAGPVHTRLRIA